MNSASIANRKYAVSQDQMKDLYPVLDCYRHEIAAIMGFDPLQDDQLIDSACKLRLYVEDNQVTLKDFGNNEELFAFINDFKRTVPIKDWGPKRVHFGNIQIREYEVVQGDHPVCKDGMALSLGWDYREVSNVYLHYYESGRRPRRHRRNLGLSYHQRKKMLGIKDDDSVPCNLRRTKTCNDLFSMGQGTSTNGPVPGALQREESCDDLASMDENIPVFEIDPVTNTLRREESCKDPGAQDPKDQDVCISGNDTAPYALCQKESWDDLASKARMYLKMISRTLSYEKKAITT